VLRECSKSEDDGLSQSFTYFKTEACELPQVAYLHL
jgi:hypothetical protein